MDRTEPAAARPPDSQSRVSPVLLWILLAAALFRVVTAVMDRREGAGLVKWEPLASSAARAAATGRPVLYDFTAAWCAPCKFVDRDWGTDEVADQVNGAFVPVRIVDRVREDGENPPEISELQRRYEVSGFPTLVVAAPDGRLIAKHEGYRGREYLLRFLRDPAAAAAESP